MTDAKDMTNTKERLAVDLINQITDYEKSMNEPVLLSDYNSDPKTIIEHMLQTKLLLRRFEFLPSTESLYEAYDYFVTNRVSDSMIIYLINCICFDKVACINNLIQTIQAVDSTNIKRISALKDYLKQISE